MLKELSENETQKDYSQYFLEVYYQKDCEESSLLLEESTKYGLGIRTVLADGEACNLDNITYKQELQERLQELEIECDKLPKVFFGRYGEMQYIGGLNDFISYSKEDENFLVVVECLKQEQEKSLTQEN